MTRESKTGTYHFSRHAIDRLIERNLSIDTVCEVLDNGRKFLTKQGVRVVLGQFTVILSRTGQYVVTIYETLPIKTDKVIRSYNQRCRRSSCS